MHDRNQLPNDDDDLIVADTFCSVPEIMHALNNIASFNDDDVDDDGNIEVNRQTIRTTNRTSDQNTKSDNGINDNVNYGSDHIKFMAHHYQSIIADLQHENEDLKAQLSAKEAELSNKDELYTSAKDERIAQLESKLIEMSMELATSKAVEDECQLKSRRSSNFSICRECLVNDSRNRSIIHNHKNSHTKPRRTSDSVFLDRTFKLDRELQQDISNTTKSNAMSRKSTTAFSALNRRVNPCPINASIDFKAENRRTKTEEAAKELFDGRSRLQMSWADSEDFIDELMSDDEEVNNNDNNLAIKIEDCREPTGTKMERKPSSGMKFGKTIRKNTNEEKSISDDSHQKVETNQGNKQSLPAVFCDKSPPLKGMIMERRKSPKARNNGKLLQSWKEINKEGDKSKATSKMELKSTYFGHFVRNLHVDKLDGSHRSSGTDTTLLMEELDMSLRDADEKDDEIHEAQRAEVAAVSNEKVIADDAISSSVSPHQNQRRKTSNARANRKMQSSSRTFLENVVFPVSFEEVLEGSMTDLDFKNDH